MHDALRNKTVTHTFLSSFDNENGCLCEERLFRSRNFVTLVTWPQTFPLYWSTSSGFLNLHPLSLYCRLAVFANSAEGRAPHLMESGFRNPEWLLLSGSGILGFVIRNTDQGIRNPTNYWNPESKFQKQKPVIRNPVPGIQNSWSGIENPRLSWILLHGATKGKTQKDTK